MSRISATDASLINDAQFLEELERLEQADECAADPGLDPPASADAACELGDLETGLPMDAVLDDAVDQPREPAPIDRPFVPFIEAPRSVDRGISPTAAALVLLACLTVGAATAAIVFHDRVTLITAVRPATR